jgi:hypothetical protein
VKRPQTAMDAPENLGINEQQKEAAEISAASCQTL